MTVCFMLWGIGYSFAETLSNHSFEAGTEISHITYREPGVMKNKGTMKGIFASYSRYKNLTWKAEGRYSFGEVDYENSGTIEDIDDYIIEIRGLVKNPDCGLPLLKKHATKIIPYGGIGYRYLNDNSSNMISSTGAWGYERESNYIYTPIGIESITDLDNNWFLAMTLEYDYLWWGKQKSHLGDVPGYYDIENRQTKGRGGRGSIELQKRAKLIDVVLGCFIRYWNIEESETTTDPSGASWVEPKNNSTEYGVKFAFRF